LSESDLDTVVIAGLPIARLDTLQVVDRIFADLADGRGGWIVTANLDFMQRAYEDCEARNLYTRADLIVADGTPLLWAARLMGQPLPDRVAGSDLVWLFADRAARENRSLFLLGGDVDDATAASERLKERYPGLRIAGVASPRISSPPTNSELARIRDAVLADKPDLIYVGFGSPKQEQVIDALRPVLPSAWMMGCGISLSFIAGSRPRAPLWMQKTGLEWVHRMLSEPRRLAPRYMRNIPYAFRLLWNARSAVS
jgi:N-acetylglucosaminyldiphosphoundecaprenol N-acetyl-beta-D-mannosaminyltransferase